MVCACVGGRTLASDAVNTTISYSLDMRSKNSSQPGRLATYTWCTLPSISTGMMKSGSGMGCRREVRGWRGGEGERGTQKHDQRPRRAGTHVEGTVHQCFVKVKHQTLAAAVYFCGRAQQRPGPCAPQLRHFIVVDVDRVEILRRPAATWRTHTASHTTG